MRHPPMEILQDYFENTLNKVQEDLVKDHLLGCDKCTKVLADFAVIENKVKQKDGITISEETKKLIFSNASKLLEEKRRIPEPNMFEKYWEEWKEMSFPELKMPALQLCSLSIALVVLVAVEKEQSRQEEIFEPLSDEVKVLTYKDVEENK